MSKTLFERIIDREIPAQIEFEDEHCIVIHDIHPQAPVHVIVIPKKEISSLAEVTEEDAALVGHLSKSGIELADLSIQKPTLESVFLKLTGRELRD